MKNRKFYVLSVENITKGYDFVSDGYNREFASRKCLCEIFENYGIPNECRKIFIEEYLFSINNGDAKEFVTDYKLDLSSLKRIKDSKGQVIIQGRSMDDYEMIKFRVNKNDTCTYEELISFFKKLHKYNLLDNYVFATEEAFRRNYIIDEKLENIKLLIK